MQELIKLFKAVEVASKRTKKPTKELTTNTIKRGFVFDPVVVYNYSEEELNKLVKVIEKEVGLTAEKMNAAFHKSWGKVRDASIEQLYFEQIVHYITTYGFEAMDIYSKDTVYIPKEKLEIPELQDGAQLVVIHGYTKEEIKDKVMSMLTSGIALKEDTAKAILAIVAKYIPDIDITKVKNKEIRVALYDYLGLVPSIPIEFLRYVIYKSTKNMMLIKSPATIATIKSNDNKDVAVLFAKYAKEHGLSRLSEIFYRFKPLFLAFRTNKQMRKITNKLRKLAEDNHKPMPEDYLNNVTAKIKRGETIKTDELNVELSKVNTFRKIRLAYALKFRTNEDADSILYKIRNGKSYATAFKNENSEKVTRVLNLVVASIVNDVSKNVKGKKIYLPKNITYTLPATEKQFTHNIPSGSYVEIPKDMVVGVHWNNIKVKKSDKGTGSGIGYYGVDRENGRVDVDLSMQNAGTKVGWDGCYRHGGENGKDVLFSGDVTDAPGPNGASELIYVRRQKPDAYLVFINWFTAGCSGQSEGDKLPIDVFVGSQEIKRMHDNYMIDPNNVVCLLKTNLEQDQKMLGLLVVNEQRSRFYFTETGFGNGITLRNSEHVQQGRRFLVASNEHPITLESILEKAGAKLVDDKKECDIDLSLDALERDTIIKLLMQNE